MPELGQLPNPEDILPFTFLGDEAFQLQPDFMRPYPGKTLPSRAENLQL